MVESPNITASSKDSLTSGFSELKSNYVKLGEFQNTSASNLINFKILVSDSSDNNESLLFLLVLLLGLELNDSRNTNWVSINSGLSETTKDSLVEASIGSSSQESVEL